MDDSSLLPGAEEVEQQGYELVVLSAIRRLHDVPGGCACRETQCEDVFRPAFKTARLDSLHRIMIIVILQNRLLVVRDVAFVLVALASLMNHITAVSTLAETARP